MRSVRRLDFLTQICAEHKLRGELKDESRGGEQMTEATMLNVEHARMREPRVDLACLAIVCSMYGPGWWQTTV